MPESSIGMRLILHCTSNDQARTPLKRALKRASSACHATIWERGSERGALALGVRRRARRLLEGDDALPVGLGGGSSGKDLEKPHALAFRVRMKAYNVFYFIVRRLKMML